HGEGRWAPDTVAARWSGDVDVGGPPERVRRDRLTWAVERACDACVRVRRCERTGACGGQARSTGHDRVEVIGRQDQHRGRLLDRHRWGAGRDHEASVGLVETDVAETAGRERLSREHRDLVASLCEPPRGSTVELEPAGRESGDLLVVAAATPQERPQPTARSPCGPFGPPGRRVLAADAADVLGFGGGEQTSLPVVVD